MTTIAYKNGELAFESRVSEDEEIVGSMVKGTRGKRHLAAAAGDSDVIQLFLLWVASGFEKKHKPKLEEDEDFTGWAIDSSGRLTEYTKSLKPLRYKADFYAIGTGAAYAKGAMAAGCTAREAVEIAIQFDKNSGHPIHMYNIKDIQVDKKEKTSGSGGKNPRTGRTKKAT